MITKGTRFYSAVPVRNSSRRKTDRQYAGVVSILRQMFASGRPSQFTPRELVAVEPRLAQAKLKPLLLQLYRRGEIIRLRKGEANSKVEPVYAVFEKRR